MIVDYIENQRENFGDYMSDTLPDGQYSVRALKYYSCINFISPKNWQQILLTLCAVLLNLLLADNEYYGVV